MLILILPFQNSKSKSKSWSESSPLSSRSWIHNASFHPPVLLQGFLKACRLMAPPSSTHSHLLMERNVWEENGGMQEPQYYSTISASPHPFLCKKSYFFSPITYQLQILNLGRRCVCISRSHQRLERRRRGSWKLRLHMKEEEENERQRSNQQKTQKHIFGFNASETKKGNLDWSTCEWEHSLNIQAV